MESSLLTVLSYILTKMVERNDKLPLAVSKRTVFHAEKAPLIPLPRYLERVLSFAPCSHNCFIIALIYIDRIIQSHSDFILNSLSVHRMLITSVMLATKFFDDETFNNLYYAKVGGLQVSELNQMEEKFLSLIDFSLTITADIFERYHCELTKHTGTYAPKTAIAPPCTKAFQKPSAIEKAPSPCSKTTGKIASCAPRPLSSSAPSIHPAPPPVRSCEVQEEKFHHKAPPSAINSLCAKLGSGKQPSPCASPQAERLENTWNSFDYAGRDCVPSPTLSTKYNMECANTLNFGTMNINNKSVGFSQCTPSYPSNSQRHMIQTSARSIAVTWG